MRNLPAPQDTTFLNEAKEQVGSFLAGAIPGGIGGVVVGGVYSLGSGIAGVIGLGGVAKATAGVLGVCAAASPVLLIGGGGAAAAFFGVTSLFGIRGRARTAWIGAAVGAGAALYGLASVDGEPTDTQSILFQSGIDRSEIVQLDDFRKTLPQDVLEVSTDNGNTAYFTTQPQAVLSL